jgi:DNA-binding GntR family transcriptional regulator
VPREKKKAGENLRGDKNLTQQVYDRIKEMMLNYEIIPGQRLVFVDLAKKLGVSRTPINNALSILANEGFLDFIPNQGYAVHQITKAEAESLYQIREIIELAAIEKAIPCLTREDLAQLKRQKELYEKAVAEQVSRGRFTLDQEFHCCYVRFSRNVYFPDYFEEVYQRIFLRHRIEGLRADRARRVVLEHNDIFRAIKQRDVEWAKKSIQAHIQTGRDYIFSVIFSGQGSRAAIGKAA